MAQQAIPVTRSTPITVIAASRRWATFTQGLFFVAGFGAFIVGFFGLVGTALGDVFFDVKDVVRVIGGIAVILFGLFTLRIVNIPFLYSDTRKGLTRTGRKVGAAQSFITGISFAAGWTPCIGPFLGAILSMSVTTELGTRLALLVAYTLGLGVPFLLVALLFDRMTPVLNALKRNMRLIEIISGTLLIVVGIALLTGGVQRLSAQLGAFDLGLGNHGVGLRCFGRAFDYCRSHRRLPVLCLAVCVAVAAGLSRLHRRLGRQRRSDEYGCQC